MSRTIDDLKDEAESRLGKDPYGSGPQTIWEIQDLLQQAYELGRDSRAGDYDDGYQDGRAQGYDEGHEACRGQ